MIRGILPTSRGYDTNGAIVLATQQAEFQEYTVWFIEPTLHSRDGIFRGALAENLFPLENPADTVTDTHSQRVKYYEH
jgi:hypothetical protein